MLRAQGEWEAVDTIQPETGSCDDKQQLTVSPCNQLSVKAPSACEADVSVTLGLGDRIPERPYLSFVT